MFYHSSNSNVVSYSLNRLSMNSIENVEEDRKELEKFAHRLASLGVGSTNMWDGALIIDNRSESSSAIEVKEK